MELFKVQRDQRNEQRKISKQNKSTNDLDSNEVQDNLDEFMEDRN